MAGQPVFSAEIVDRRSSACCIPLGVTSDEYSRAEVEEKGKALEALQQLADQMALNLGGEARVKVVFNTLNAVQELLEKTPPRLEASKEPGSDLRAAAFQLIAKLNFMSLVQASSSSYIKLSGMAFDACLAAITSDNEENGRLSCKTMGMIIKGRRQVLQHYPNSGVEYNSQIQTLVNLLMKVSPPHHES
jgi:hypothetical protein